MAAWRRCEAFAGERRSESVTGPFLWSPCTVTGI